MSHIALVTGAGRGIGRAIAKALAAEGIRVAVTARSQSELDTLAAEITGAGGQVLGRYLRPGGSHRAGPLGRASAAALGADRDPGEQRRHRQQPEPAAAGRVRRQLLGPDVRRERDRALPAYQARAAGDDRAPLGADHQHRQRERQDPQLPRRGVHGQQARRRRTDQGHRPRGGRVWHHRQRHLSRRHAFPDERQAAGVRRPAGSAARSRS